MVLLVVDCVLSRGRQPGGGDVNVIVITRIVARHQVPNPAETAAF